MLNGHLAVDTFQKCGNPKREWKIVLRENISNLFRLLKIKFSRKSNAITGKRFTKKKIGNFLIEINSGFNPGK